MDVKILRPLILLVLLASAAVTLHAGGWSIITLKDYPDHALVGDRLKLTFSIRQHGNNLLEGLEPAVRASISGGSAIDVAAFPTGETGEYSASFALPNPGDWTIRIDGGFNHDDKARTYNAVTLPPLRVVRHASEVRPLSDSERGNRLFIAKGCIGCHAADNERDLSGKRFEANYLKRMLADPSVRTPDMPNLALKDDEISALIAFINRPFPHKKS